MKPLEKSYKRVVVKVGSSLFYKDGQFDPLHLFENISQLAELIKSEGREVVIVSSGAIALGMHLMKIEKRPKELSLLQALAAVGQSALVDHYNDAFRKSKNKVTCAQVLLTRDDFDSHKRYLNAKNTLLRLLKLGILPVVNENDTISTEEIKFGDNDRLSALVATLIDADLLVILSDVDGLLDREARLVKVVGGISPQIKALACPTEKKTCVGGMITKIEAAKISTDSGIPCVIAKGGKGKLLFEIIVNPAAGGEWTLFLPRKGSLSDKERWMAFGIKPKGKILVDQGAQIALMHKKSLLSVGVCGCEGNFQPGDIVSIADRRGRDFARAKTAFSSRYLSRIKGQHAQKEAAHCDNIVIL